jgi:ElaB/YqjD/DUF883 family membrane-anchored ribosome-binding protein
MMEQKIETEAAEAAPTNLRDDITASVHEIEHQVEHAREALYDANRKAVVFIRENPGLAILGAFGVGYVVGKLAARRWFV